MLNKKTKKHKIGVFGGTFNPPHIGHVQAAEYAIGQLNLDKLIIIPTGNPPHKKLPENSPSAKLRLKMAQIVFKHLHNTIVSDMEIIKQKESYTVNTIAQIHNEYPDSVIYLLMGSDMYLSLDSWKEPDKLLSLVVPTVFSRKQNDSIAVRDYSFKLKNKYGVDTEFISNQIIDISSSQLRELLPKRFGYEFISDNCYSFIIKNNLYNAKSNLNWLRSKAYLLLNPNRIEHTQGCEESAISLAVKWGVDSDEASEAAILHDITKGFSSPQHMEIFDYNGVLVDIMGINEVKLLHSKSGAVVAKAEFSVSDSVCEAIKWHTTGRCGMTTLDKIIYLADYIEPTRDFSGVDELRKAAFENLDNAMIIGLEMTISDLESRNIIPNKLSLDTLSDLKEGLDNGR